MKPFLLAALLTAPLCAQSAWEISGSSVLGSLPKGAEVREVRLEQNGLSARVIAILFASKSYSLHVVDSPDPGRTKLADVLEAAGCVAGVNGSYFHEDFRPVGLQVSGGRRIQGFEKARLLSGVLFSRGGRIEIVRSGRFQDSGDVAEAVQCGPMLVDGGQAVAGLNDTRSARRTVVATDGKGRWALIYMTSVTLADAARILTMAGVLGTWAPATALNLDGGSSSGLWAATTPAPVLLPELGHVRNYVGISPRP